MDSVLPTRPSVVVAVVVVVVEVVVVVMTISGCVHHHNKSKQLNLTFFAFRFEEVANVKNQNDKKQNDEQCHKDYTCQLKRCKVITVI